MAQSSPDDPAARTIASQSSSLALMPGYALSPINRPELVEMIISNLTVKDSTSAARVCRMWSEPALDQIWHTLTSLIPLLRLVGRIRRGTGGEWDFTGGIQDANWSRFAFYAPRIRNIIFPLWDMKVSDQAFQAIVDHIPSHLKLPRPSSIQTFTTSSSQAITLISQSLRKLVVGEAAFRSPLAFVPHIRAASVVGAAAMLPDPCLERLEVTTSINDATLLEAFNACLAKHSSKISSLKARLPFDSQTWASIFDLPALQNLNIAPLSTDVPIPSAEVLSMIQRLVAEQPLLKSLRLDLPIPAEQNQDSSLYFRVIQELMGLRNLETLVLYVTAPLSLSESDVREMGASWPKIRNLQFHHSRNPWEWPPWRMKIQNDLSIISSFLLYLPSLEELHILLTCNSPLPAPQEPFPAPAFRILNVGTSPRPKASHENVVAYLAAILPPSADVRNEVPSLLIPQFGSPSWRQIIDDVDVKRGRAVPVRVLWEYTSASAF